MQQSPCFKSFSPEDNTKFFPSIQRFNNNGLCSPRTLFFSLGLSSSVQNSYSNKNILSKMKCSTSNAKKIFNNSNKPVFLSNKRYFSSESTEKNNNKNKNNNNKENINKTNKIISTVPKKDETAVESQKDAKKTKASSMKYSTYIPSQFYDISNANNYNPYGGCITDSSLIKFNKSTYIGSVKKNLLPSLSKELKSNTKIKNQINNSQSQKQKKYTTSRKNKTNTSNSKSNQNLSSKKTNNDSIPYDFLCKIDDSLDLEKMVDYIVSSTKIYNRYNDNKENFSNNKNEKEFYNDNKEYISINNNNKTSSGNKSNNKIKKLNNTNSKIDSQKLAYSLCKCKKVECLKYSCSCLKSGNKCCELCSCFNCKNKDNRLFKIE